MLQLLMQIQHMLILNEYYFDNFIQHHWFNNLKFYTHTHTQIYIDRQKSFSNLNPNHSYVQYD
jgi:hypothetical protein